MTYTFSTHSTDDMGVMHLFFHFGHDMGVCVFWVCPTTPMTSAGTIWIIIEGSLEVKLPTIWTVEKQR